MTQIWQLLVDDPRAALSGSYSQVLKMLLDDMGSRSWRVRESAALACAELVAGRGWEEVEPRFQALWQADLRFGS